MKRILEALASGRTQVVRAVQLDALPSEEFVPSDFLTRAIEEHAQQTAPTAWTRLKMLELIVDRLNTLATAIDLSLANYGQMPAFDGKSTRHVDLKRENPQSPPPKSKTADKARLLSFSVGDVPPAQDRRSPRRWIPRSRGKGPSAGRKD